MSNIGFIGLGIMGESMCENVIKKSSTPVYIYDVNESQVQKMVSIGGLEAKSSKEIGKLCSTIIIMVPKSEHVKAVITEVLKEINKGTLIIDMSTIDPSVSREMALKALEKGCRMIDAPVVKSKPAAIKGELGIYVGGEEEDYLRAKPILSYMGSNIIRMGLNGSGLVMKICHNMLVAQIQNGVNEMLTLATTSGLDFEDIIKAISFGGGQNFYLDSKKNSIKNSDFTTNFSVENMDKDINIASSLSKELNLNLPGLLTVKDVYEKATNDGLSKEDFSATIKVVKKYSKVY